MACIEMPFEADDVHPEFSELWQVVRVRNAWKLDLSTLIVEANDGLPYCRTPQYNSFLGGLHSSSSPLSKLALRGDSSGSRAEIARDILRRISGTSYVLSKIWNAILRSAIPDTIWRIQAWVTRNAAAEANAIHSLAARLTERGIPLRSSSPVVEVNQETGALSCNYKSWISVLSSWLVYYIKRPSKDALFGTEQLVGVEETHMVRKTIDKLHGRDFPIQSSRTRKDFDADEVSHILSISPLAAACLWSIAVVACTGHVQQLGGNAETREGVLMKYSLGKLLLYIKGNLKQVTRGFSRDISRTEHSPIPPATSMPSLLATQHSKELCFRPEYRANRRKHVFELPGAAQAVERIECDYLAKNSHKSEGTPDVYMSDDAFSSFKSLATLAAFQIDVAEVSKAPVCRRRTILLNRSFRKGENESEITKTYRSMLRKMQITPDALISKVSELSSAILWIFGLASFGTGLYAAVGSKASWMDRIDAVVKVSAPIFLFLVIAEYLSVHENFVKVLLTNTIEIKKLSCLARFLGLSYNEALWLVVTDPRASRILHSHGTGFLRNAATGPLMLDRISRPRETVGDTSVWGVKVIVDEIGARELTCQPDGTLHVNGPKEIDENGLVIISLEGSSQIRGTTAAGAQSAPPENGTVIHLSPLSCRNYRGARMRRRLTTGASREHCSCPCIVVPDEVLSESIWDFAV